MKRTSTEQHQHHHQQEDGEEEGGHKEEISCNASMHIRMPGPIVQASQGGICPIMDNLRSETNTTKFMRQPVLRWPTEEDHRSNEDHDQPGENAKDEDQAEGDGHWVEGAEGKEKDTYRDFLRYCEERRQAGAEQCQALAKLC